MSFEGCGLVRFAVDIMADAAGADLREGRYQAAAGDDPKGSALDRMVRIWALALGRARVQTKHEFSVSVNRDRSIGRCASASTNRALRFDA